MNRSNDVDTGNDLFQAPCLATHVEDAFQHSPLPEGHIRLVKVISEEPLHSLRCEIIHTKLAGQSNFIALSYRWGSGLASCPILLNGKVCFVSKNLGRFLRHIRSLDQTKGAFFWIDALCIDQSSNDERSHQVTLMPTIYSRAAQVLVWLGPAYHDSDIAMRELARPLTYWTDRKKKLMNIWTTPSGTAIRGICTRLYWTRLWIFQELMLAQDILIMCGDAVIPWVCFKDFLTQVNESKPTEHARDRFEFVIARNSPAMSIVRQLARETGPRSLWDLLRATKDLRCFDQKDHVYALLGVSDYGHEGIAPDYTMPMPELMNATLKTKYELLPPSTLEDVASDCRELAAFFGVDHGQIFLKLGQNACLFWCPGGSDVTLSRIGSPLTLWWAAAYGHLTIARLFFEERLVDLDTLMEAVIHNGDPGLLSMLHKIDRLNPNWQDTQGRTVLYHSALRGHRQLVQMLLTLGAHVSGGQLREDYSLPLDAASLHGYTEIMKVLFRNGARLTERSGAMLSLAARDGYTEVVKLLLDEGIDVDASTDGYPTALCNASRAGYLEIVELLLHRGVDINARVDHSSKGPQWVAWCQSTALEQASEQGHLRVVELLLSYRADPNDCAENNATALQQASMAGHDEVVRLLLAWGAEIDLVGQWGEVERGTALHAALSTGQENIARELLALGAGTNTEDPGHPTALQLAVTSGLSWSFIEMLLSKGADVNVPLDESCSLLDYAITEHTEEAVERFQTLLTYGADLNRASSFWDGTALKLAIAFEKQSLAKLLSDDGAYSHDGPSNRIHRQGFARVDSADGSDNAGEPQSETDTDSLAASDSASQLRQQAGFAGLVPGESQVSKLNVDFWLAAVPHIEALPLPSRSGLRS